MIYLSYYFDFELQGRLWGKQKNFPHPQQQQQQQLGVLLDLSAIGYKKVFSKVTGLEMESSLQQSGSGLVGLKEVKTSLR